nr:hypothetical protein CFP56_31718 [Quercus suber]
MTVCPSQQDLESLKRPYDNIKAIMFFLAYLLLHRASPPDDLMTHGLTSGIPELLIDGVFTSETAFM